MDRWEDILGMEALNFIKNVSYEEGWKIDRFFGRMEYRIKDEAVIINLAKEWHKFDSHEQAHFAVHHAGYIDASRFMILMDYLDLKVKKGELK